MEFSLDDGILRINPHLLVGALRNHFEVYVRSLKDPSKTELRENFQRRFDHGAKRAITMGTRAQS